ncbi:MAG TPA: cytochrome P460 family protein [Candidatus Binatia bacterium]|nr:cytochrome P460 family protein [Candidatus Binatia bacterium]
MLRTVAVVTALGLLFAAALLAGPSAAGPEKIAFPKDWERYVLYATVDRPDVKQYRELYASSPAAVEAMKQGRPLPYGTVLVLVQYRAQLDAQGNPVRDARGRFVKGERIGFTVMEKQPGWGAEYPPELRNGEWEYSAFTPDGRFNDKANIKACFQCHKPHERQDFVISLASLAGGAGAAAGEPDVKIAGFAFSPARLTVAPGRAVTWLNDDPSPHQITVTTGGEARGPVLTRGQRYAHTFTAPGVYDYICGLHPAMKGQVEVK